MRRAGKSAVLDRLESSDEQLLRPSRLAPFTLGIVAAVVSLLATGCGTAAAEVSDPTPASTELPASPEAATQEQATVDGLVNDVLVGLGETGYYGACPTIEDLGLDPLAASTPEKLAAETKTQHCSWTIAEHDGGLTLNLDRLDVFGDEALYYLAVVADGTGWRLADATERVAVGSELISPGAVYIDDLLPT